MRYIVFFHLFIAINGLCCAPSNPSRHLNPDGTIGGLIDSRSKVSHEAYVGYNVKVCDRVTVESNVHLTGHVVLKNRAWVGKYVQIKDLAEVGGEVILRGEMNSPIIIKDKATIFGSVQVFGGTKISGSSQLNGFTKIYQSEVVGNAKICSNYIIRNQFVDDDYYCASADSISKAEVKLVNYSEEAINKRQPFIEFMLSEHRFSVTPSDFQIHVNGRIVDPLDIKIRGDRLRVANGDNLEDGFNTIQLSGRDDQGKRVVSPEMQVLMGSESVKIDIASESLSAPIEMKFDVSFYVNKKKLIGSARYREGKLLLLNVPVRMGDALSVSIKGLSKSEIVFETFDSISSLPKTIFARRLPKLISNDLSYTDGLASWQISNSDFVSVVSQGGAEISSDLKFIWRRVRDIEKIFGDK